MRRPQDIVKVGEAVEVVVLGVNPGEKRISLGLGVIDVKVNHVETPSEVAAALTPWCTAADLPALLDRALNTSPLPLGEDNALESPLPPGEGQGEVVLASPLPLGEGQGEGHSARSQPATGCPCFAI